MKMKKKILVYMLTLCLIIACSFALTACSSKHKISIEQNDYYEISTNVSEAKYGEKVTISYTKKENFEEKLGYEVKFVISTADSGKVPVSCDESDNYYFNMPDCDVSISAEYVPIQYTITYDLNGGENNANNPTTYTIVSNDIIISQPTYTNYYFSGWTINDGSQTVRDYTIPSGTTGNITLKANWKRIVSVSSYSTTYSGEELSVNASDFVSSSLAQYVEISGDTKGTNAGIYEVTLTLKDKVNYCWEDGTTEDKTITWEITKRKIYLSRYFYTGETYSGEELSVTTDTFLKFSSDVIFVDITGTTSATNVGTYNVTLSLKDKLNYCWGDGTTDDIQANWSISKYYVSLKTVYTKSYSGKEISVTSRDFASAPPKFIEITGTTSAINAGTYNVTISLKDKANFCWKDGTTEDKNLTWRIGRICIELRSLKNKVTRTYSGNESSVTGEDFAYSGTAKFFDISGTVSATNAGTYNVTLSLKDKVNYCWDDFTSDDKTRTWEITKRVIKLGTETVEKSYSSEEVSISSEDFVYISSDAMYVYMAGTTYATNIGTYNVTLSLEDKTNYCWDDETSENKTVTWEIVKKKIIIRKPYITYSGESKSAYDYLVEPSCEHLVDITGTPYATKAGTYSSTLSLKDKANYCWDDGTTEDKTVTWEIKKRIISEIHTHIEYPYTGSEILVTDEDFSKIHGGSDPIYNHYYIIGTGRATDVGTYSVVLSLTDKENYCWSDGTTDDIQANWSITAKASIDERIYSPSYTGEVITAEPSNFADSVSSELFTISGTTSATTVGTYEVTLTLKDKSIYRWDDGTTEDKTVIWKIKTRVIGLTNAKKQTYCSEELSVTNETFLSQIYSPNPKLVDITGTTSATNVGTYNVSLSLKDKENCCWNDGTTEDKTLSWEIVKYVVKLRTIKIEKTYSGEELSVTKNTFLVRPYSFASTLVEITGTTSATNAGTYNVSISLKDKENTSWEDGTTNDRTISWNIQKHAINLETVEKTYSSEEISVTSEDFVGTSSDAMFVDVTGTTSATNPGTYNVTISLKDKTNYCWADGTTDDKTVTWEIVNN